MIFTTLNGRQRDVPIAPYLINWDAKREVSKPQAAVKRFLRPYWEHKTVLEEFRVPGRKMRVDLLCLARVDAEHDGIVVEVSPAGSHSYNPFFHRGSTENYKAALKRELHKERWAELNRFLYIELMEDDLKALSAELFAERFGVIL